MAPVRNKFVTSPYRNRSCQTADEHVEADRDKAKIVGKNLGESDHRDQHHTLNKVIENTLICLFACRSVCPTNGMNIPRKFIWNYPACPTSVCLPTLRTISIIVERNVRSCTDSAARAQTALRPDRARTLALLEIIYLYFIILET